MAKIIEVYTNDNDTRSKAVEMAIINALGEQHVKVSDILSVLCMSVTNILLGYAKMRKMDGENLVRSFGKALEKIEFLDN